MSWQVQSNDSLFTTNNGDDCSATRHIEPTCEIDSAPYVQICSQLKQLVSTALSGDSCVENNTDIFDISCVMDGCFFSGASNTQLGIDVLVDSILAMADACYGGNPLPLTCADYCGLLGGECTSDGDCEEKNTTQGGKNDIVVPVVLGVLGSVAIISSTTAITFWYFNKKAKKTEQKIPEEMLQNSVPFVKQNELQYSVSTPSNFALDQHTQTL